MRVLITGSSGLIGSEAVTYFDARGHAVYGIDNNMRMDFFGPRGDTRWNLRRLQASTDRFTHFDIDIRDRQAVFDFFAEHDLDAVVHCAAQPSHDLSRQRPLDDFDVNAVGTVNLLEAARRFCPEAPFVHMSTNKVYGDAPNELPLVELGMALQRLSVIVPNYNRADALPQTIRSLARQSVDPGSFEVLVVDDGYTDNSVPLVTGLANSLPVALRLIRQENLGPGAARNHGVQEASSDLLLFWDSDMIAAPTTVDIHCDLHLANESALVAGARRPWAPATTSLFAQALKAGKMGRDHLGEAPSFWEALSSNLSIQQRDFEELGGFDERLWAFEDIDLAYRAQQAGLALVFSREAIGYHNHQLTLNQVCQQQLHYQRYAAAFLAKHPELRGQIDYLRDKDPIHPGADPPGMIVRKLARQLIAAPPVLRFLQALVPLVEKYYPKPNVLSFLYWKIVASFQLVGYRAGLREFE